MITSNLFEEVLIKPVNEGADKLLIVSGYATSAMAFHHLEQIKSQDKNIEIQLIVGMAIQDGLSLTNHRGFQQLVEEDFLGQFICSYIFSRPAVHSKVFVWLKKNKPIFAYTGSANYTQNAFIRKQKEVLAECNPEIALDYFQEQAKNSIYCTHIDAENLVQIFSDKQIRQKTSVNIDATPEQKEQMQIVAGIGNLNELESVCISLLASRGPFNGQLAPRSGLNWGQRPEYKREPNQAYIRVPKTVADLKFFPERGVNFTILTDDNKILTAVIEQDNAKAITTPQNNSLIGIYFRNRLDSALDELVPTEKLISYGRTDVCFYKVDDETYYMDFSV
jgi:HKD family nuclease